MPGKKKSPPQLIGNYRPPALRRGQRADCLVRDCTVVVTTWTDAPIPWPRGCPAKQSPGGPGIIVDEELARAVRHESAAAIRYWWGVSNITVAKWRKALGVTRTNNEGTHALILAAIARAKGAQNSVRSEEYRQRQREHTLRNRPWESHPPPLTGRAWTAEEVALLGTMTDAAVAARIGRSRVSVKTKRRKLGIPPRPKSPPG